MSYLESNPESKGAVMKIIIDNQSLLDFGEMMGVVFELMNNEAGFIGQNKTGCHFISKSMQITTNVWQDSDGLNFKITDLAKERTY
jgi:hypothetical protein